jgi:hypothetical protein
MKVRIIAAVLLALVALTSPISTSFAASAGPTTVIVSPGSRVCIPVVYGYNKVHGQGDSDLGVLFSLHQSSSGSSYTTIAQSGAGALNWTVDSNAASSPGLFPAWFKLCARNQGSQGATVTLTLQTDADAP